MVDIQRPYTFDRVVRLTLSVVGAAALFVVLRYLADVLVPFAAAAVLAYLLNPLVNAFESRVRRRWLAVALTLLIAPLKALAAVWTDQQDYSPGSVVTISGDNSDGAGYLAGETVYVDVNGPNGYTASCEAVADDNGAWSCQVTLWADELAVGEYTYTAIGQQSGVSQSGTFTDGPKVGTVSVGAQAPNPVTAGNSVTYTVTVNRGSGPGSSGAFTATLSITTTLPTGASASFSPNPVSFAPGDSSKTATLTISTTCATPGGMTSFTVKATRGDNAADNASGSGGLNVTASPCDTTPPVITPNVAGTLGNNGWYVSNVTVSWTVSDPDSAISSSSGCGSTSLTTETTGTTVTCSATSAGGTSSNSVTIKIDKTGPSAALLVTAGTAGTNGWYTSDVTVDTDGTDSISSPVTCTADQFQTSETTGAVFNGSCTNDAGLTTNAAPLTVKLDKTGPSATLSVTAGTLGTNGWYTSGVTVHTSGSDAVSDNVICTADQQQTTETTGTEFNGSCTNDAGLTTNAAPLTVKLDKTGPTAALSASGTLGNNGWYVSNVTIHTSGLEPKFCNESNQAYC